MARKILVEAVGVGGKYRVTVEEAGSRSVHEVSVSAEELSRYGNGAGAERVVEASFEFLLEREAKESILRSFRLGDIERYFPDYGREIGKRV
jgi:hypothetical protein